MKPSKPLLVLVLVLGVGGILAGASAAGDDGAAAAGETNHPGHRLLQHVSEAALHAKSIMGTNLADPATVGLRIPEEVDGGPWWDDKLWWQDIDYDVPAECGINKCFLQSASHPEHGFVIAPGKAAFDLAKAAFLYEKELEASHGIRVTSIGRPILAIRPKDFNKQAKKMKFNGKHGRPVKRRLLTRRDVTVQEVHKAPEGSIVWKGGCKDEEHLSLHIRELVQGGHGETLAEEMEAVIPLVEEHPELAWDFQVLIDNEGLMYHIDLERAMHNKAKDKWVAELSFCLRQKIDHVRSLVSEVEVASV